MRRKTRNPDKYQLGRSSLAPYISSESWQTRHHRRMNLALQNKAEVELWCKKHRWRLEVKNNGHHWIFWTHQNKMIEWWPSSGKLTIGKNWKSGIHCHDYQQLLETLEMTL